MDYNDSEAYKIFYEFKSELERILIDESFRFNSIARQMARGALYYKYTRRVLLCLADEDNVQKALQDVLLDFTSFAVTLGERAGEVSD